MEREIRHLLGLEHISPAVYKKITLHNAMCGIGCSIAMMLYGTGELFVDRTNLLKILFCILYLISMAAACFLCVKTVRGTFHHPQALQVYGQICLGETIVFGMVTSIARINQGDHFLIMLSTVVGSLCLFRIRPIVSLGTVTGIHLMMMYVTSHYQFWITHSHFSYIVFLVLTELVSLVGWHTSFSNFVQEGNMADVNTLLLQDNETWRNASVRDSLTGLFNRYGLNRNTVLWRGRTICVMMCDVDNFKHYNDTYGHDAGDLVLQYFSGALKEAFGDNACYRYGGDEFLVVSDTAPLLFMEKAKNVQKALKEGQNCGKTGPIGTSMGFVYGRCRSDVDLPDFIRQADRKLYQAKESGKGTVLSGAYSIKE